MTTDRQKEKAQIKYLSKFSLSQQGDSYKEWNHGY